VKITVLKYGSSVFGEHYIFRGGDPSVLHPISFVFYLIETENRRILVDVGCNDGAGFVMDMFQKPTGVLADYGLSPADITDVILTHAHHDHVEAVGAYTNARVLVHQTEKTAIVPYLPLGITLNTFTEKETICPDVTVMHVGGHSPGSSIVLCRCGEQIYVLCGDECYIKDCFEKQIPTGASCAPAVSEQFVRTYGQPPYVPLLFHDPAILSGRLGWERITE